MTAPTCVTCGSLTYYVAEDRNHYCFNHIPELLNPYVKSLTPLVVRKARAIYAEVDHRSTLQAIDIKDEDWEDLDLWYNVGYYWDLNVFTSVNGLLCATLYPVREDGTTKTDEPHVLIADPSYKIVSVEA
jgi:hypothetical protein